MKKFSFIVFVLLFCFGPVRILSEIRCVAGETKPPEPFLITGSVRDLDGKPLSHAEITIMGYLGHRPGRKTVSADENGNYSFRFSRHSITAMWMNRNEPPTPEKPELLPMSISAERPGYVWKGVRKDDGTIVSDKFLARAENGQYSRTDSHGMTCVEPEPTGAYAEKAGYDKYNAVFAEKPAVIDIVMRPAVRFRGELPFDEPVEPADPNNRSSAWTRSSVTFNLPRAERASRQPVFYGPLEETGGRWRFDVSVLPYEVDAFLSFTTRLPGAWKEDVTVARTDWFKMPPTGDYTAGLRWDVQEKDGRKLRKLRVDSIVDAAGKAIEPGDAKPVVPVDYLLNRWMIEGTVRDDQGGPLQGAEVGFYRHDGWMFRHKKSATTDAGGRYRIELEAVNRYPYGYKLHGPGDGELCDLRVKKEGFSQRNFDAGHLVFLSDKEDPGMEIFSYKTYSTDRIVPLGKPGTADVVMNRNAKIEGDLSDENGKPLAGFGMLLRSDRKRIDNDARKQYGLPGDDFKTDENGKFDVDRFVDDKVARFQLSERAPGEKDMLRTHGIRLSPGDRVTVRLRLETTDDGSRRLSIVSGRGDAYSK